LVTLHQLRCFLATLEHGSFTAAAADLQLSQPSLSEQVRQLERSLNTPLFHRLARGVTPTEAAQALRPHAHTALAAVDEAGRAVSSVREATAGTLRFGLFGAAHLYLGGDLVADVLHRHPGLRVILIGQNSMDVIDQIQRGRLEAGLVALPVDDNNLDVHPVLKDEIVYVSANPQRVRKPVTPGELGAAPLVLSEATWGNQDYTRQQLTRAVQSTGGTLRPLVEVENVEAALDVAARGIADTIAARGVLHRMRGQLPRTLRHAPLRPKLYDQFAIVHRRGATLSRPTRTIIEHAITRMKHVGAAT
jgi:DNA-binding transcriptional LysR family regulator